MDTISLKRYEVNELVAALKSLSGRPEVVKDGDGKVHGIVVQPYDLSGKARFAFAKTLRGLSAELEVYESVQKEIQSKKFSDGQQDTRDDELRVFMLSAVEVQVHKVNVADVKLETNKLPPQVIAQLLPMLDGDL